MLSDQIVSFTPGGRVASRCAAYSRTAWAMAISFSVGVAWTATAKLGLPSKKAKDSTSAKPSLMVAMSPNRRRTPSGRVNSTICSNSAPV